MQSRHIEVSTDSSTARPSSGPSQTTQYGDLHNDISDTASPIIEASSGKVHVCSSADEDDIAIHSSEAEQHDGEASNSHRLKPTTSRNSSPVHRTVEHEKYLTPSPRRKGDGPDFRVLPETSKSGTSSITLTDFPNGTFSPYLCYRSCKSYRI